MEANKTCSKCAAVKPATKESFAIYRAKGVEKLRPECRDCSQKMCREYKARSRSKISDYNRVYKASHKEATTAYNREYFARRRHEDHEYRIKAYNRSRVANLLRGKSRDNSKELLSCSYERFIYWLEYQFDERMTMENYGTYWHLDHVIPCASFDLNDPIAQKQCFHWSNYRPCEGGENIIKGDKIDNDVLQWHKYMIEEFILENQYDMVHSLYK